MRPTRVLICEDEEFTAKLLETSLPKLGFEVVGVVDNGEDAVKEAERLQPDIILMDIRMPQLDGITATERIMSSPNPVAIIMVTAYNDQDLVEGALRAGASGYLIKPVSDEQIGPAITVALNKFSELRDLTGEVTDLKEALETRKLVERAKGVLMRRYKMMEDEAYHRIQKIARDRRQTLRKTAEQILSAAELLH